MSVLRVYDPAECDEHGVPLDWTHCRMCIGTGFVHGVDAAVDALRAAGIDPIVACGCPACAGHGSLKAAALAACRPLPLACGCGARRAGTEALGGYGCPLCNGAFREVPAGPFRCEDCRHPMGEGVFEGDQPYFGEELTLAAAFDLLREGTDPADFGDGNCTHYSPCDEGCRHGGPGRWTNGGAMGWGLLADSDGYPDVREAVRDRLTPEAAWRPVDVRTLGWPHDLRFEKLAVLCLRCWAARMGDGVHA